MTNSSSKVPLNRLGPVRPIARNESGSREKVVLTGLEGGPVRPIDAMRELARTGVKLSTAKRKIEEVMSGRAVGMILPVVSDPDALVRRLADLGIGASITTPAADFAVKPLREKLKLTQEEFAVFYGFEVKTIRNYEQGQREPDAYTSHYLDMIATDPKGMMMTGAKWKRTGDSIIEVMTAGGATGSVKILGPVKIQEASKALGRRNGAPAGRRRRTGGPQTAKHG